MDMNLFPTKGNLIKAKNTLSMSKQGYELLDRKRNILIREMMGMIERAENIQSKIATVFAEAYEALQIANITIGIAEVDLMTYAVPEEKSIGIRTRSVMGVEIPTVIVDDYDYRPPYGLSRTNIALDMAKVKFEEVKKLSADLAEVENTVYRLASNIKRTQKRANALKNIMIPRYENLTLDIANVLEEKEREEFTRLKVIKRRSNA